MVGGLEYGFYGFPYIGNSNLNWLILFKRGWNHQPVIFVCGSTLIDSWLYPPLCVLSRQKVSPTIVHPKAMDDEHVNYNPWIKPIYTLAETNIDVQKNNGFRRFSIRTRIYISGGFYSSVLVYLRVSFSFFSPHWNDRIRALQTFQLSELL